MAVGEWQGAAVSYVNALSLNPGAEYVWDEGGAVVAEGCRDSAVERKHPIFTLYALYVLCSFAYRAPPAKRERGDGAPGGA